MNTTNDLTMQALQAASDVIDHAHREYGIGDHFLVPGADIDKLRVALELVHPPSDVDGTLGTCKRRKGRGSLLCMLLGHVDRESGCCTRPGCQSIVLPESDK